MEGKGGCCIARYAGSMAYLGRTGGGGGGGDSASSVDRIMLRYRPIAPKPASGGAPPAPPAPERANGSVGRTRRRGAREGRRCRKQRKTSSETNSEGSDEYNYTPMVTLPLLPLTPERRENEYYYSPRSSSSSSSSSPPPPTPQPPMWLNGVFPQPAAPLWSCVTVECVTDTCVEWDSIRHVGWSCGDEEQRRRWLEADTCPAFVTDAWNCVRWVNDAYRQMVGQGGAGAGTGAGVVLALVTKEKLPETRAAFSCRVRVQYTCGKERNSLTAPCDVWRLAAGGAAWRLDVDTALCLGR